MKVRVRAEMYNNNIHLHSSNVRHDMTRALSINVYVVEAQHIMIVYYFYYLCS